MQQEYAQQTKNILAALDAMPHVKTIYFHPKNGYLLDWHISPRPGYQAIDVETLKSDLANYGKAATAEEVAAAATDSNEGGEGEHSGEEKSNAEEVTTPPIEKGKKGK